MYHKDMKLISFGSGQDERLSTCLFTCLLTYLPAYLRTTIHLILATHTAMLAWEPMMAGE